VLDKEGIRQLAYVVLIDKIEPIVGSDNCESAVVGGWHIMVRKGQFNIGDPAIYFEIDSKVPADRECFAFLEKRHYKVKTQKFTFGGKGNFISQGLLMHPSDFGWHVTLQGEIDDGEQIHTPVDESRFLTKQLGVTYADEEDNARKAAPVDKYKKMAQRHAAIFKKPWARWMMHREWGRKIMFFFFGKKKDKKNGWPSWVSKTDEERVQNMPWILEDSGDWVATEKIDGTSTTFTMKRGKFGKKNFYVCSRNVCFGEENKPCYYDTNVYWEMAKKYNIFEVLSKMLEKYPQEEWITIQGETYGEGVQKRDYSLTGHDFAAFNLIFSSKGRVGTMEMLKILAEYGVPCVPVLEACMKINQFENVDAILAYADGNSVKDDKPREGIVFRSTDGTKSFKAVSNSFLLQYHG
jgi:hypothetical protein